MATPRGAKGETRFTHCRSYCFDYCHVVTTNFDCVAVYRQIVKHVRVCFCIATAHNLKLVK